MPLPESATPPPLRRPVESLRSVGGERTAQLARLGIHTVEDLLLYGPSRYEDRAQCWPMRELRMGEPSLAHGQVVAMGVKSFSKGTKSVFELILDDGTARLHCRWWNLPFMEKYFSVGQTVFAYGRLKELKPRTMDHPETEAVVAGEEESIHLHRIVPVYRLTEGLPQRWLRALEWRTVEAHAGDFPEPWRELTTHLPHMLPTRAGAVRHLHFPATHADAELARQRLALDEFIALQRDLGARRRRFETRAEALPCRGDNRLVRPFLGRLGFALTRAQARVLRELRQDLGGTHPMRRLLQGDVGSGKTAVAAVAALMVLESGFNVALMAPTEILAEQHCRNFVRWFEPLGVAVEVRTGSRKTRVTDEVEPPRLTSGRTLFIGTHALLTASLDLPELGLVIIDEQHKFGVAQREQLVRKGRYPHLLVMTATPIPRTLGLTLYGDLDLSTLDEMPPGRGRIRTYVREAARLPKVWEFLRDKLAGGRQAYLVYPRVEDTAGGSTKAVLKEFETVQAALAPHRVALLHGRMNAREQEEVMAAFRANTVQALLATSLIEVGVDVPNATLMVIENAEQFGLAQLHQLRGRIGRGAEESFCILISDAVHSESRERLRVLEETTDGFRIAEADLLQRGPGELLGQQQSGLPAFRFGDLREDFELIQQARDLAARLPLEA
jgi:ATP-dependent DNA helicase RecG